MTRASVSIVGAAVALAACGSGVAPKPRGASFVESAHDASKIASMLHGSVTNGGLWFEDGECAKQFQAPGEILPSSFAEFARCLAALKLRKSSREDSLGDVVVLEYGAGFEVQARVVQEVDGPRLSWIGFVAHRLDTEPPTVTSATLESLREGGDANGPLDAAVAARFTPRPDKAHYTWFKICLDETGAISRTDEYATTSLEASAAFGAAVRAWTFKPFTMEGQPMPVCAMVRPSWPAGTASEPETLPLPLPPSKANKKPPIVFVPGAVVDFVSGARIKGERMVTPADNEKNLIAKRGIHRIVTSWRLCLDEHGQPESILPYRSSGFAGYDRRIIATMQAWRYRPFQVDGQPVPVCIGITFIYSQR